MLRACAISLVILATPALAETSIVVSVDDTVAPAAYGIGFEDGRWSALEKAEAACVERGGSKGKCYRPRHFTKSLCAAVALSRDPASSDWGSAVAETDAQAAEWALMECNYDDTSACIVVETKCP